MNMFKPTTAKTPKEYIEMIDEPRKSEIVKLDKFIRKTVPKLKSFILVGMIAYGVFPYKNYAGKIVDWATISLASQKNYISVYVCATTGHGYLPEKYKKELPKANIGKSCIRFKKVDDINLEVLAKIFKEAEKLNHG